MQEALLPELSKQCGNPECSAALPPERPKFCSKKCRSRGQYLLRGGKEYVYALFLESRYGITAEDYRVLAEAHGGCCAICGDEPQDRLHIDHDHHTGIVRGLLCRGCNHALGNALDDPARLRAMADYLERHAKASSA